MPENRYFVEKNLSMTIEGRKYQLIEQVMTLSEGDLKRIEAFLEELYLDPQLKEKLTQRALQSEKDIKEGRIYTLEEAEARLHKRLGL